MNAERDTDAAEAAERSLPAPTEHKRQPSHHVWPQGVPQAKADFLREYITNGGVMKGAADAVGVTTQTIRNWLKADPAFLSDFETAKQDANDTIRREIVRRATEGWQREVYQMGHFVGYETVKSDNLLMFYAKSRMPEFRERVDITSNDQHINAHETIVEAANDPETSELAARLLERLATAGDDSSGTGMGGL